MPTVLAPHTHNICSNILVVLRLKKWGIGSKENVQNILWGPNRDVAKYVGLEVMIIINWNEL